MATVALIKALGGGWENSIGSDKYLETYSRLLNIPVLSDLTKHPGDTKWEETSPIA